MHSQKKDPYAIHQEVVAILPSEEIKNIETKNDIKYCFR